MNGYILSLLVKDNDNQRHDDYMLRVMIHCDTYEAAQAELIKAIDFNAQANDAATEWSISQ